MIEQLPCGTCTGLCCGTVAITKERLVQIRELLGTMPRAERERLAKQKRDEVECQFLDKTDNRCTIYPVRPWVCAIYGRTEGLVCPKVGHLVQIMPAFLVDQGFAREGFVRHACADGLVELRTHEKPAGVSTNWNWRKMDFER